jgi:hypothetical protein
LRNLLNELDGGMVAIFAVPVKVAVFAISVLRSWLSFGLNRPFSVICTVAGPPLHTTGGQKTVIIVNYLHAGYFFSIFPYCRWFALAAAGATKA